MDTLKTAVVIVLLLAVLYGFYVILNKENQGPLPEEIAWSQQQAEQDLNIEMGMETSPDELAAASAPTATSPSLDAPQPSWRSFDSTADSTTAPKSSSLSPSPIGESPTTAIEPPPSSTIESNAPSLANTTPSGDTSIQPPPLLLSQSDNEHVLDNASTADTSSAIPPSSDEPATSDPSSLASTADSTTRPDQAALPTDGSPSESSTFPTSDAPAATEDATVDQAAPSFPDYPSTTAGSVGGTMAHIDDTPVARDDAGALSEPDLSANAPQIDAFASLMSSTKSKIENGQWYDALLKLSFYYYSPEFTPEQREQMLNWLDALAGKVIYSTEHLIEEAYEVQNGDTLTSVAERYQIPVELLANINGISDPNSVPQGTRLKVVRGPFEADVSLATGELTLFVNKLYAGRFPVTAGSEPAPQAGEYRVADKQFGRTYYSGGRTLAANDPSNPFGGYFLDLGNNQAIHGSSEYPGSQNAGCVRLGNADARDVFGILSSGSRVVIRR